MADAGGRGAEHNRRAESELLQIVRGAVIDAQQDHPADLVAPGCVDLLRNGATSTHRARNHSDFECFRFFEPTLNLRVGVRFPPGSDPDQVGP
jgi:hypothetical protein